MNEIIDRINAWRIEDGKGRVIDSWFRAGGFSFGRFPVWAWQNRRGKVWQAEIEKRVRG